MKELKKLKYRFVLIVMVLLFTVTGGVFAGIYYTMYRAESMQSMRMLEELADRDGGAPKRTRPIGSLPLLPEQTGDPVSNTGSLSSDKSSSPVEPKDSVQRDSSNDRFRPFDGFADGNPADFAMFRNSFSIRLDGQGTILSLNSAGGFFQRAGSDNTVETLTNSELE